MLLDGKSRFAFVLQVFKHTFDVFEDYVTYLLITVGTLAVSVRVLTTLGSGDVQCILLLVNNSTDHDLGPYPSKGTMGFLNYAQFKSECSNAVFTWFWLYLPYIMLIQTIVLIVIEKFTLKIPKISQRVERFYK